MAILRKGIISAPSGKIANLMCYRRLSRDIIQKVPTVTNSYLRQWNLLKALFTNQLTHIWNTFSASVMSDWQTAAAPGQSGFDYFVSTHLSFAFDNQWQSLRAVARLPSSINRYMYIMVNSNWLEHWMQFLIPSTDPFWTDAGTPLFSYFGYDLASTQISFQSIGVTGYPELFNIVITTGSPDDWALVRVIIRHTSPFISYWDGFLMTKNNSLIDYNN